VQQIFNNSCAAVGGCHLGPEPLTSLNLSAGSAFGNLVPIKSSEDDSRLRINPGDPDASYLYQKIIAGGDIAPGTSRMPLGCSGATCLSDGEIQTILDWINNGAPPPQP
jgi:hypothetical protein